MLHHHMLREKFKRLSARGMNQVFFIMYIQSGEPKVARSETILPLLRLAQNLRI
jgi:hypothetical protein